jgi:AcrR family transcriptional regulator
MFASNGLLATKISDISSKIGLSYGLLYHYFKSKESIFIELVKRAINMSNENIENVCKTNLEPVEKLYSLIKSVLDSINNNLSAYYFILIIQVIVNESVPKETKELLKNFSKPVDMLCVLIKEGQNKGTIIDGNVEDITTTFWSIIYGIAIFKISDGENFKMPDYSILINMFKKKK